MAQTKPAEKNPPMIVTKLLLPALPDPLVSRPRLTRALNQASGHSRLLLVSAQAGSGKTTAVLEWLHQADSGLIGKVAWLSLDDYDNEAVRFWHYVCQSLENGLPDLGHTLSSLFYLPQQSTIERILSNLINTIVDLDQLVTLVLDDYHVISAPEILQQLAFLLDRLPSQMRIVMTSRVDPSLPLPRLRMRRQLTELRATDLRFTQQETGALLTAVSGQTLTPNHIAELENKTEGWVAALQMAGLLLQSQRDMDSFVRNFSGSQRFMLDFLAEEVLLRQPEDVQHFLLQTSILEHLTASLTEEVTGCEDGHAMLQRLLGSNLFLIPLDDGQQWFRYHHLFRQYLLKRLEQTQPEHIPLLHTWAANWYAEHELPSEAIEHALKAEDFVYAADLIDKTIRRMYERHELQTLWRWLQALPLSVLEDRPHTGLDCAWTHILQNRYEAAVPYIELVQRVLQKPTIREKILPLQISAMEGEIAAVLAFVERNRGHFAASIELSNQALELVAPEQSFLRCAIVINQGYCYADTDDLTAAFAEFVRVETLARSSGDKYFMLLGMVQQARLQAQQGQLFAAQSTCQRAIAAFETPALPVLGIAYAILASLYREWNELDKAAQSIDKAVQLLEHSGELNLVGVYIELAQVRQAQGDFEAAWQGLERAAQLLFNTQQPLWAQQLEQARVRFWLAQHTPALAVSWEAKQVAEEITPQYLRETSYIIRARLLLGRQQAGAASELAGQAATMAAQVGRLPAQIEALVWQAQALYAQKQTAPALAILEQAVQLAQPAGFERIFAETDKTLLKLLHTRANNNPSQAAYVHKLLLMTGSATAPTPLPQPTQPAAKPVRLIEPLTEREQEVLRLLATTALDSTEIAENLSIAVSTLRTHVKNIYAKLEVQNRLQAITRARELSLLAG